MEGRESMKKYRLLSVLVILSLALTACGGNPASGGDSSKAQQAQETQSPQAAPGGVTVEIIETEIPADGVINTEGYGSLSQTDETWMTAPQYALIDSSGNVVFDYGAFPCRIALNDGLFVHGIVTEQGEGWSSGAPEIVYADNVYAGTAEASVTLGEARVSVNFTIATAPALAQACQLHASWYKRLQAPEDLPEALLPYYRAKGFYLEHAEPLDKRHLQADFLREVEANLLRLKAIYGFFRDLSLEGIDEEIW